MFLLTIQIWTDAFYGTLYSIISLHNKKILKDETTSTIATCNCWNKHSCPIFTPSSSEKCRDKQVVYIYMCNVRIRCKPMYELYWFNRKHI